MKNIAIAIFASLLITIPAAAQSKTDTASQQSAIPSKWIAAWNSHDVEKLVALFTPDVTYEDVPFSQVSHGSADLRKFVQSEFESCPDLHVELVSSWTQGGHGVMQWIFSGTDKGFFKTGKKFSVRGASIIELKNGKISHNQDYYDAATLMRAVGVLPESATTQ